MPTSNGAIIERSTPAQFIEAFDTVVASKGLDYVYPDSEKLDGNCRYAVPDIDAWGSGAMGDCPSCVVGYAVFELAGVAGLHSLYEGSSATINLTHLLTDSSDPANYAVRAAAGAAQGLQDAGWPWGVAQKAFHYVYEHTLADAHYPSQHWYGEDQYNILPHTWADELGLTHLVPAIALATKV